MLYQSKCAWGGHISTKSYPPPGRRDSSSNPAIGFHLDVRDAEAIASLANGILDRGLGSALVDHSGISRHEELAAAVSGGFGSIGGSRADGRLRNWVVEP